MILQFLQLIIHCWWLQTGLWAFYQCVAEENRNVQAVQGQKSTLFCTLLKDRALCPHNLAWNTLCDCWEIPWARNPLTAAFPLLSVCSLIWMQSDYSAQPCLQLLWFFIYECSCKRAFCSHKCLLKGYFSYEYLHSERNKGILSEQKQLLPVAICWFLLTYSKTCHHAFYKTIPGN